MCPPSFTDSWQRQPSIRADQTSASHSKDLWQSPCHLAFLKMQKQFIYDTTYVHVCRCEFLLMCLYLSGVLLLPCSFISSMISEESRGELALASRRSCSCWARYWAGVCLASLAQWSNSLWSKGRFACSKKVSKERHPMKWLAVESL